MTAILYDPGRVIRGSDPTNSPSLVFTEVPSAGSASTVAATVNDMAVQRTTVTPTSNNVRLSVIDPRGINTTPVCESLTPSECSVDGSGLVTRQTNGTGSVKVTVPGFVMRFDRVFSGASTVVTDAFDHWQAGSLAAHIDTAIRAMVASKVPGSPTQSVLSSFSGPQDAPVAVRNGGIFTGALDLTPISVMRTTQGWNIFPAVLVTARHIITGHVAPAVGEMFTWLRSDGIFVTKTVLSVQRISEASGEDYVALLDSAVAGITPMLMMPANWATKLPSVNKAPGLMQVLNKGHTAGDFIRVLENYSWADPSWLALRKSTDATLSGWSSDIIGGDSTGPVFVPVNGAPVLLHCMNTTAGGAHYSANIAGIQAQLNALATAAGVSSVNLSAPDLSGFTSF